jgi:hypothetical protein
MELTEEQINKFIALHKPYDDLGDLTEAQIRNLAQGVANFYLALFKILNKSKANLYGTNRENT